MDGLDTQQPTHETAGAEAMPKPDAASPTASSNLQPLSDDARANLFAYYHPPKTLSPQAGVTPAEENAGTTIYHPRTATMPAPEADVGYQLTEEQPEPLSRKASKRRKKRTLRRAIITLAALIILGIGLYTARKPIGDWLQTLTGEGGAAPTATAIVTPEPVRGYIEAPAISITAQARSAIGKISGTISMDAHIVTQENIVTKNLREDGALDYYLFAARNGRLIAYYEDFGENSVFAQPDGHIYLTKPPYLVAADGNAAIKLDYLKTSLVQDMKLYPVRSGWAALLAMKDQTTNFINMEGRLFDTVWYARAWPFTGENTVAWLDTGNPENTETRYLLYVLNTDGTARRWRAAPDMSGVVASACGTAYMKNGELYELDNMETPLIVTDEVHCYLDCGAITVRDPESGKYGLFVDGEKHYDFIYDSILPVPCDITWAQSTHYGEYGVMYLHAVIGASYPQPLSHSFALVANGKTEYVALSATSCYPVIFDEEFQ